MQIIDLYINGFGKFYNKHISFETEINIIYGNNEAGKSTIHSFLKAMFYGLERARGRASKNDMWAKFEPWKNKANYGGYIRVKKEDTIYRIERDFSKNAKRALVIVNETLGREEENGIIDKILNNLSKTAYSNTISIGQLRSSTDASMTNELRNYIANMNNTGNDTIDITKALDYLKAQKKSLSALMVSEVTRAYASNLSEIKKLEEETDNFFDNGNIKEISKQKDELIKERERKRIEVESLGERILKAEKCLSDLDIEGEAELGDLKEEFLDLYDKYTNSKFISKIHKLKLSCIVLAVIVIIVGAMAGYMYLSGPTNLISSKLSLEYDFGLAVMAWVTALSAIALTICSKFLTGIRDKRNLTKSKLLIVVSMVTGKKQLNEENIVLAKQNLLKLENMAASIKNDKVQLEVLKKEYGDLDKKFSLYAGELEKEQKTQWEFEKKIEHLSNLRDENMALKSRIKENDRIQAEVSAIDMAMETLTRLSADVKESFGFYLNKEASDLINGITRGLYNSISIDRDLNIFINTKEKLIPIDSLSSGTMDQIYLALRLAAAKLLQRDNKDMLPLILDDSFVNYDSSRLAYALEFLVGNYVGQILIFSCHPREVSILKNMEAEFGFINL